MIIPRIIGLTDEVLECELCGNKNLRRTVVLSFDGDIVYYGSDCAAKQLGRTRASIERSADHAGRQTAQKALDARKRLSYFRLPWDDEPTELQWRAAGIRYSHANPSVRVSDIFNYVRDMYARDVQDIRNGELVTQ